MARADLSTLVSVTRTKARATCDRCGWKLATPWKTNTHAADELAHQIRVHAAAYPGHRPMVTVTTETATTQP